MTEPDGGPPPLERIRALQDLGRYDEAMRWAAQLAGAEPTPDNLVLLSELARRSGDLRVARLAARDALAAAPDDPECAMAVALAAPGNRTSKTKVLKLARDAVALGPDQWHLHANAALVAVTIGRPTAAARFVRHAIELAPLQPDAWRIAARVQLRLGDVDGGQRSLERSLQLQPQQPSVIADLAFLEARRGHLDEAIDLHRTAINAAPAHTDLLLMAGRSANRRTLFPVAVVVGFLLGLPVLSVLGGFAGAMLGGIILNAIDERRVRDQKAPLLLPKRYAAQPGMGRAVIEYRRHVLNRQGVGPKIGVALSTYLLVGALAVIGGLLIIVLNHEGGGVWLIWFGMAAAGWGGWRRVTSRRITDA